MRRTSRLIICLVLLSGVAAVAAESPSTSWSDADAAHLLRRAGFGGTPQQVEQLHALGRQAAVEYLLTGRLPAGTKAPVAEVTLAPFQTTPPAEDRKEAQKNNRLDVLRLRNWWIDRMVRSDRPLEEKMTLFWHGLFTSGVQEVRSAEAIVQQHMLLRENAMGNYRQLTAAILRDPAMLRYLDANQNIKGKPNENLARELLELFTLGEGNGYTERDIKEVARALTGLSIRGNPRQGGDFFFARIKHDHGQKTIFGKTGSFSPDDVVDLIFEKKQPANYLARRLWIFFGHPEPTQAEISPVADALLRHKWDVKPALRVLFNSEAFYAQRTRFALIKSPVELAVGTYRTMGVNPTPQGLRMTEQAMRSMGQELFQPPNVRGWPGGENWITSATLYVRYNLASSIVTGKMGSALPVSELLEDAAGKADADAVVQAAIDEFLQRPLPDAKKEALAAAMEPENAKLRDRVRAMRKGTNVRTEMAEQQVRQMLGLLVSTPEYQVQ